jgi:signal transduction histidine kinase
MAPLTRHGGLPFGSLVAIALVRTSVLLPVGYAVARIVDVQRRQRAALADANARLARYATTLESIAAERERHRLAHELHDTLAHGLSGIAVQLEAMLALWAAKPDTVRAMLGDALTATRTALSESRRAIKALRAHPLEDMGLAQALRQLAESAAKQSGLELSIEIPATVENLDSDTEHAIYRIASEAIANILRHAQARRIDFKMTDDGHRVQLTIADDGRGFDATRPAGEDRFGLYGMQERARLVGAELVIDSAPGKGATLQLNVRRQH